MKNFFCCVCNQTISCEQVSNEHVIPNALGGRIISKQILCKKHNSFFGDTLDKDFINIFAGFSRRMDLSTDRKTCDRIEGRHVDLGVEIVFKDNKVFPVKPYYDPSTKTLYCQDEETKEQYLKKLLKDGHDISAIHFRDDLSGMFLIDFKLDNEIFKKGFGKIAVNYAVFCGLENFSADHFYRNPPSESFLNIKLIPWLPDTSESLFEEDLDDVMHVLTLRNDPWNKILYCYVELFSTFKHVVLLAENWSEDIFYSYCFNLTKNKQITLEEYFLNFPNFQNFEDILKLVGNFKKRNLSELNEEVSENISTLKNYCHMLYYKLDGRIRKMVIERKLKLLKTT